MRTKVGIFTLAIEKKIKFFWSNCRETFLLKFAAVPLLLWGTSMSGSSLGKRFYNIFDLENYSKNFFLVTLIATEYWVRSFAWPILLFVSHHWSMYLVVYFSEQSVWACVTGIRQRFCMRYAQHIRYTSAKHLEH